MRRSWAPLGTGHHAMAAVAKCTTRPPRCSSARRFREADRRAAGSRGAVQATETADGGPRREDGPEATRTDETEIEIATGDRDPEIVISGEPVRAAGAASGTRGTRGTTAGAEATAETEIEGAAIAFPDQERLEATVDLEMIPNAGVLRVAREPSRLPAGTGMTAGPSAKPVQAPRRSPGTEP